MKIKKQRLFLLPSYANGEERLFILDALRKDASGHSGDHVVKFTEELADVLDVEGIRLVSNAPSALHLLCRLAGVERGDIVFCSDSMAIELAEPVLETGAELVLIDSDPDSWNMSPAILKKALKEAAIQDHLPKLIIVSHSYGKSARIEEICMVANKYGVMVVEDAGEALGTTYKGKMCGTWGEFGLSSFDSDKMITTSSGGALISSCYGKLGEELNRAFLSYPTTEMGYTYSMSNILAGMGRAQLMELETRIGNKQEIYRLYKRVLQLLPGVDFPPDIASSMPNRWLTTMLIDERKTKIGAEQIIKELGERDIEATHLKKPLHSYLSLQNCRLYSFYPVGSVTELIYKQGIGLPTGAFMTAEEQFRVIVAFRNICQKKRRPIH